MERRNSRRKASATTKSDTSDIRRQGERQQGVVKNDHVGARQRHNVVLNESFRVLSYILILLACLSICIILFLSPSYGDYDGWVPQFVKGSSKSSEQGRSLALLHPEHHVDRPVTTLHLQWNITKGVRQPDGVKKDVYLINEGFPGPTIEARSGDRIVVDVHNGLRDEGVAIHWHGLRLEGANHMDGAVGITQEAIAPGRDFTYDFTVGNDEAGAFWYHGHEKTQRDDGLYGGFIIHRPLDHQNEKQQFQYDDEVLLMAGDWYHRPSTEVLRWYMSPRGFGNEPVPDSLLLNGYGNFDCSMAVPARPVECLLFKDRESAPKLVFQRDKRYRLRFVNTGSLAGFTIQIPGASLTLVQVDGGQAVVPSDGNSLGVLYPGERSDVILEWKSEANEMNIVIELDDENFGFPNPALNPKQIFPCVISGSVSKTNRLSTSPDGLIDLQSSVSPASIIPSFPPDIFPPESSTTFVIYTTTMKLAKHHNIPMGFINRTSWTAQASPTGALISLPRDQWDKNQLVPSVNFSSKPNNQWITLVINNLDDGGHPFHLHGYSFYVLSVYPPPGISTSRAFTYNPFKTPPRDSPAGEYNNIVPIKKDTVFVPRRGYVVLRLVPNNAGIWMLHCHVGWHLGSGMAMAWEIR